MYRALDIAFWLIAKNDAEQKDCDMDEYEGITNMKIQKLLYFAQGIAFSFFGIRLFSENLLAWEHGPVIREVYTEFAKFGRDNIVLDQVASFNSSGIAAIEVDTKVREILTDVYECLNKFTAYQLRNISHDADGPWARVYEPGVNTNVIQLDQFLVDYFKNHFEQS